MSVLRDLDLLVAMAGTYPRLCVDDLVDGAVQPASIDLRLDDVFLQFPDGYEAHVPIDPMVEQEMQRVEVPAGEALWLRSGGFVLGSTVERIAVGRDLAARIEGKSSIGRLGIEVHSTAGWIDPGFRGHVTLEIKNVAPRPVLLWPGMFIAQLACFELTGRVVAAYGEEKGSHYQDQPRGPVPSKAYLQFARRKEDVAAS